MPVTSFALLILAVLMAAALTVWAVSAWGALTVLPVLMVLALAARWAMAHVPHDDPKP
ncbi:hypothetical protein [Aestuariicoccus sp. MJ-SS9]|uniref:hypothetical protein n=1 Tax=Aestuariicoccus sp. MJ-SS9 TaxID=3079855 RepID=UPI002914B123|nr:hypothetical protein [Aestuariicoccus sp. MJ-SS9]MDU8911472.1 hypothetical protein [Aestuariicoccus sp. MJ-SS9]